MRTTSSHHGPLRPGRHTCYNGKDKEKQNCEVEQIYKPSLSSDCSLQLDCMKLESLVIVNQPCHGEYVPGSCTHRRHTMGVDFTRSGGMLNRATRPRVGTLGELGGEGRNQGYRRENLGVGSTPFPGRN